MAKFELTPQQRQAVEETGGALLVSAAAGSGKTKVLVDRLLRQVTKPGDACNVDDFLIITYTRAAAGELRGKIAAALQERLAESPDDLHLQRQLHRVYLAQISTVHAFCAQLLRQYAAQTQLPVDFRVAEESDCAQLRAQTLERVLEEAYAALEREPDAQFFLDTLGAGRSDARAAALIDQLFDKAVCQPDPDAWLARCGQPDGKTPDETPWGKLLLAHYREVITRLRAMLEAAGASLAVDDVLQEKYAAALQADLAQLDRLAGAVTWEEIYAARQLEFIPLARAGKDADPVLKAQIQAARKEEKEQLTRLLTLFSAPAAETMAEQAQCSRAIRGLVSLTRRFAARWRQEKRRRKWLDFSDLEQETRRLLCTPGGAPTAIAREVSQRYREIMVDEYQDSNRLQDSIFFAISREGKNVFLVGDVKQSIYRFRLADPTIFLEKYRAWPNCAEALPGQPRCILLSQNFRSRAELLDATNDICRDAMSQAVGDVDYNDAEALRCGRVLEEPPQQTVELHCIDLAYDDETEHPEKRDAEAAWVAQRIEGLLREAAYVATPTGPRRVEAGDIVILLSTMRSVAPAYVRALQQRGIPVSCDQEGDLLACPEITQLVSLLQVIDNPHQDIPLYAALASPLLGFTADEIAQARAGRRQGDLYACLQAHAETDEKTVNFLEQLRAWRAWAAQLPVDALLAELYRALDLTGVFGAMPSGSARISHLRDFFCLASGAVQAGNGWLHGFLRQLEGRAAQGIPLRQQASSGAVRIMSIHKSKGLEFPVVILAGLSKRFNLQDMTAPVLLHPQLGAAVNVVDLAGRVQYPSAAKRAMALQLRREMVSEELRVLYVALTRARDMLIMTYAQSGLVKQLAQLVWQLDWLPRPALSAKAARLGDWVLQHAMQRVEAGALFAAAGRPQQLKTGGAPWRICLHDGQAVLDAMAAPAPAAQAIPVQDAGPALSGPALRQWMAFQYPDAALAQVPSKITATQLKGRFLDQEVGDAPLPLRLRKASFQVGPQPLRPAQIGTATHLAMQFLRYEACTTLADTQAEIARLQREEYLTPAQAEAVSSEKIWRLFQSPLGQRILNAPDCIREFKFSVLADAGAYFPQAAGQEIMLQGVTDCCLVEPAGLVVIDFKTDRVTAQTQTRAAAYYQGQLDAYAKALAEIFQKPVQEKLLYFFATEEAVPV